MVTNSSVRHRLPVLAGWRPSARNAHLCSVLGPAWRQPDKRAVVARSGARARGRQDHLESNSRSNGAIRPPARRREHKASQSAPRTPEHSQCLSMWSRLIACAQANKRSTQTWPTAISVHQQAGMAGWPAGPMWSGSSV